MPCPHFDVKIIQRSKRQSAVASAAYQSGERLFSEYDQKQKYYSHKSEIVHTEIMLPPHAPPEYADRNTLWNAAEAIEKQWNSQLARRFVLAIPRELPRSQYADLIRDYCREFFVSKGMIADFAIHDKGDGNPHAHILLTMRAMALAGNYQGALDVIRTYWGAMLDVGATTFWEDFNMEWLPDAGRIDELVPAGKKDIHGDYGAYCYQGFRHSLCHGWASGPTSWLSEYVLGVQVVEPGCRTVRIIPHLGDLEWVEGTFPTPYGVIEIRHEKGADGKVISHINAPEEIRVTP